MLLRFRDSKVVERVCELVAEGRSVLVVRGAHHVKFIAQELEKRGVPYEIVRAERRAGREVQTANRASALLGQRPVRRLGALPARL